MGKSSSQTIGYWYHPAFHMGLGYGPADALLEIRGGDKTAWSGELTASGTITINKPGLFGGEKDQGGIQGDMDVMFGEATQQPNAYLTSTFGNQQPAWRGLMTVVFKGGRYGAMNPYPQKISFKWRKIKMGWDGDPGDGSACWYPERAAVPLGGDTNAVTITDFATGFETNAAASFQLIDSAIANTTVNATNTDYYRLPLSGSVSGFTCDFVILNIDRGDAIYLALADASGNLVMSFEPIAEDTIDPVRRAWVNYTSDTDAKDIYGSALLANTQYSLDVTLRTGANNIFSYVLRQGNTVLATGTAAMATADPAYLWFGRTSNDGTSAVAEFTRVAFTGSGTAMNPAHILYYAKTQQHMGREPTANMKDASFKAAADWFYSQGFGLCTIFDASQESSDAFIQRIEKVAGCSMTRSPADGLWYLDVANGQYDINSLPVLTDDDILAFAMQPATLDSAINSVSVQFFDPQQKTTVSTRPVEALALVSAYGRSHQDTSYPEIPTAGLALRVAQRDLQATATPTHGFEITAMRVAHGWRKGVYFRLQAPKHGVADMVCIVGNPDSGTLSSGAIKFTAVEDIYSLPSSSFAEQEPGVDTRPSQIPIAIVSQFAFEAPYFALVRRLSRADLSVLPADAGYLMTVAADPATSRNYDISVSTDGGTTYVDDGGSGPWCPTAEIVEGDTLQDHAPTTSFTLTDAVLLSSVVVGAAAVWDGEIVRVDAIDANALTLTLGRGCADTPPTSHAVNSRIWFFDGFTGTDSTEYTSGETIGVKLLTNTGSDQLNPVVATPLSVTFDQRQSRPYAPGKLTINGESYPSAAVSPLTLAWAHRDRLQEADQLVDTSQDSIGPETGTTYTVRTYLDDTLTQTLVGITDPTASPDPGGFGTVRVEIDSVVDSVPSWKPLSATFDYRSGLAISTTSPIRINGGAGGTYQMEASGGLPPLTWSIDPGTPPPTGITMDSAGLITYDNTVVDGDTAVTFHVEDSVGNTASSTLTLSVNRTFLALVDSLSPVAHWRMDETSGTSITDRIGSAVAALTGGASCVLNQASLLKDDADASIKFTSGGYANTAAASKWALGTGDYSFFVIAKWTYTALATVLNIRDSSAPNVLAQIVVNRATTGDIGVEGANFSTSGAYYRTTDTPYNDGKPHGIGLAFDSATGIMRLTIDGVYKGSNTVAIPRPTAATMRVNISNNYNTQGFVGTLDEVVLFDHKLSDSDMADLASHIAAS